MLHSFFPTLNTYTHTLNEHHISPYVILNVINGVLFAVSSRGWVDNNATCRGKRDKYAQIALITFIAEKLISQKCVDGKENEILKQIYQVFNMNISLFSQNEEIEL